jgi:hypothetical protein
VGFRSLLVPYAILEANTVSIQNDILISDLKRCLVAEFSPPTMLALEERLPRQKE